MSCEPLITIWGKDLIIAQSMTLRVALETFAADLQENGCGEDDHGIKMTELYLKNINEIRSIIFGEKRGV